jgi:hypothetical protein
MTKKLPRIPTPQLSQLLSKVLWRKVGEKQKKKKKEADD